MSSGNNGGGSSGTNSSQGGGSESSSPTPSPETQEDLRNKKISNLQLLEKEYNSLKEQFENYLLNLPTINFDINKDLPLTQFNTEYDIIISNYEKLPKINIKDRKEITIPLPLSLLDFNILDYNYKITSKRLFKFYTEIDYIDSNNIKNKYLFFEIIIDENEVIDKNTQVILDYIYDLNILKSKPSVASFNNSFIKFTNDVNYLVDLNSLKDSFYLPISFSKEINKDNLDDYNVDIFNSNNTYSKTQGRYNIIKYLKYILFTILILLIIYFLFFFKKGFVIKKIKQYFIRNKDFRFMFKKKIKLQKPKIFNKKINPDLKNKLESKKREIIK